MQNNTHIKRGIAWSSIGQIGTQTISFGFGIVLARLISPTEFGILAMVTVFTGFAEIFKDLGFGAAIVQKKRRKQSRSGYKFLAKYPGRVCIIFNNLFNVTISRSFLQQ